MEICFVRKSAFLKPFLKGFLANVYKLESNISSQYSWSTCEWELNRYLYLYIKISIRCQEKTSTITATMKVPNLISCTWEGTKYSDTSVSHSLPWDSSGARPRGGPHVVIKWWKNVQKSHSMAMTLCTSLMAQSVSPWKCEKWLVAWWGWFDVNSGGWSAPLLQTT